jgi:hypothetical protein
MAQQGVVVKGAPELARALAKANKDSAKALTKTNRDLARSERDVIRSAARSGTRQQQKMAGGIGARASRTSASISVRNTKGAPGATSTFWGQKGKYGWYANPRYRDSPPQGPTWVGNSWTVATKGQGPHVINDTLADRIDEIGEKFLADQFALLQRLPSRPG